MQDYYNFIRHPMDLATIKKRLENHYYLRAEECILDFSFIFLNCFTYNKGDDAAVSMAKHLQFFYKALLGLMPIKEVMLDGIPGK